MNALGYDAKGNVTSDGSYSYTYSSGNLLTSLTNPAGTVQTSSTYSYDPLMRLAKIDSSNPALDSELGHDGQEIVYEGLSDNRTRRYVFGPGPDEPLVAYLVTASGTSRNWLSADERGSTVAMSNDSGTPNSGAGRYDEYGVGAGLTRFRYTGQYWLGDSSLHYYRARIYDPRLGRFLQPDPIGYAGGMNLYAYVGGDPVNLVDPGGRCSFTLWGKFRHNEDWSVADLLETWVTQDTPCGYGLTPTNYFSGDFHGGGGGGGGGGEGKNQCATGGRAAGTVAIPIPKAPNAAGGAASAGIMRVLGVLGLILSLSGDTRHERDTALFRAVNSAELGQIKATGQFATAHNTLADKQFWLSLPDAQWFANAQISRGFANPPAAIVTTSVSSRTLGLGHSFSDAGHRAISFSPSALPALNADARRTGIHMVQACGG